MDEYRILTFEENCFCWKKNYNNEKTFDLGG